MNYDANGFIDIIEKDLGRKLTNLEIQLVQASYNKGYGHGKLEAIENVQTMLKN